MSTSESPLRVIAPPSRADVHPLRVMLERAGAVVLEVPGLLATTPLAPRWDEAVSALATADLMVVSGASSATGLIDAARAAGAEALLGRVRVAAIGGGAIGVLRSAGVPIGIAPRRHTADDVSAELGELMGKRVLLVRVEGADPGLPRAIRSRGGTTVEVPGYRMVVDSTTSEMDRLTSERWHWVAFANPTAVRYFASALEQRGWARAEALAGVGVAVAGPATAAAAREAGFGADLVAAGTLRTLVASLIG